MDNTLSHGRCRFRQIALPTSTTIRDRECVCRYTHGMRIFPMYNTRILSIHVHVHSALGNTLRNVPRPSDISTMNFDALGFDDTIHQLIRLSTDVIPAETPSRVMYVRAL